MTFRVLDVIIPSFNEEKYVAECIKSVIKSCEFAGLSQDHYAIFLVDGGSSDQTLEIALALGCRNLVVKENPGRYLANGWNIGIRESDASYLLAMNAHATIDENYVKACLSYFHDSDTKGKIVGVGGALETLCLTDDNSARAVALIMGS